MLLNYVKVALRRMRRHAGYTAINVIGLAVGLAVCACIGLYLADELSYDDFHPTADRLYRLVTDLEGKDRVQKFGLAPQPAGPALESKRPEVRTAVRLYGAQQPTVRVGSKYYRDRRFFYAEPGVFDVFGFSLKRGDSDALSAPGSVVLTEQTARAYFSDQDPLGRTILVDGSEYTVAGIVADPPSNTHLTFEALLSYSSLSDEQTQTWGNVNAYTYLVLSEGVDPQRFAQDIAALVAEQTEGRFQKALGMTATLQLQHVPDIHLHSDRRYDLSAAGDIRTVYLFGAVALLVLLIACINFVNLATARSMDRAREVGVRKAIGATQHGLAGQFLAESILTVVGAAILAAGLTAAGLPLVNTVSGKALSMSTVATPGVLAGVLGGVLIVGVLAGSYPALLLSRFQPARALRNALGGSRQGRGLRQALVIFQFAVAVALVIGVAVIFRQFSYMQNQDLGFRGDRVLVADLRMLPSETVGTEYETVKQELARHPSIESVSITGGIPGRQIADGIVVHPDGLSDGETRNLRRYSIDADYLETLDIKIVAGRSFRPEDRTMEDPYPALINETAVQALGWSAPEAALGTTMTRPGGTVYEIVGVIEDYHHFSLQQQIEPTFMRLARGGFDYAAMRVASGQISEAIGHFRSTWSALYPAYPAQHFFLDDDYDQQYRSEQHLATIFGSFAGLALFVACLGLLGLAAFMVRQRRKELSIRKVLGATISNIIGLLSKEFLILIGIAFGVAAPVAYVGAHRWLQGFAYRVGLGPGVFLGAGLAVVLVALGTVSVHSIRAALMEPAAALGSE